MSRSCPFIRPDGRPCRATPLRDGAYCVFHDPGHTDEVAEARRLGGLRRRRERALIGAYELEPLTDSGGIVRLLEIAGLEALALDATVGRGRLLVAVAQAATRLLESASFEERLAALEAAERARRLTGSLSGRQESP